MDDLTSMISGLIMDDLTSMISGLIDSLYNIYQDQRNWAKMAPSKKQELSFADAINDENATLAYLRQREFQEDYLTPEAQMRSTAAGYAAVGLNPMLMAGASPGASSASAPQASAPSATGNPMLGNVLGPLLEFAKLKQQKELQQFANETDRINAETAQFNSKVDAFLKREQFNALRASNRYADERERLTVEGLALSNSKSVAETYQIKANTDLLQSKKEYQDIMNKFAPDLFQSDINQRKSITTLNYARAHEVEVLAVKHTHEMALIDRQKDKIDAEVAYLLSQKDLNEQMVNESMARISKINKEIEEIGSRIGLNNLDIKYYLFNHSKDVSNKLPFGMSVHKELFGNDRQVSKYELSW